MKLTDKNTDEIKNEDIIKNIAAGHEVIWLNEGIIHTEPMTEMAGRKFVYVRAAQNRLIRFMPYIEKAFPETAPKKGIIESGLIEADGLKKYVMQKMSEYEGSAAGTYQNAGKDNRCVNNIENNAGVNCCIDFSNIGRVFIKDDAHLPIAGSVKARGGIYEVMVHAEHLAMQAGLLKNTDNYGNMYSDEFREFFGNYTIQVGSTGNLGLSIGLMASKLGFKVIVHMSSDAVEWKKKLLREAGVTVKECETDYTQAVAEGRRLSAMDEKSYFIDDENSENLFLGYATAALRLKVQLFKAGVSVDEDHPLFVYLPCGVGGAPGGITYGLKQMFGDNVHCFFAEPTGAPCFTYAMASGTYGDDNRGIDSIGLKVNTIADGLAVGKASKLVCEAMHTLVSGSCTVEDERLKEYMQAVMQTENLRLEPSACAGVHGLMLWNTDELRKYREKYAPGKNPTHIVWATGGGLMPISGTNF